MNFSVSHFRCSGGALSVNATIHRISLRSRSELYESQRYNLNVALILAALLALAAGLELGVVALLTALLNYPNLFLRLVSCDVSVQQ